MKISTNELSRERKFKYKNSHLIKWLTYNAQYTSITLNLVKVSG